MKETLEETIAFQEAQVWDDAKAYAEDVNKSYIGMGDANDIHFYPMLAQSAIPFAEGCFRQMKATRKKLGLPVVNYETQHPKPSWLKVVFNES